ncbi:hypothetical protein EAH80_04820 [Mycobacterium hodleri]|uniref:Uncharacterized protein n=2 Tax=Mycolicibacterium hodleri TaxID=49897 RepID=A0A502EHF7_9MYCO|nr:hypothetical protein EAH80_04820 [Mycolicibacterium hodleri]
MGVEDVTAPPELLTLAVGVDPILEVGPLSEMVVADVGTVLVSCICDEVFCGGVAVAVDGAVPVADVDVVLDPEEAVGELSDEEAAPDEEVVLVSAEAGAATARTVPPVAASPRATRAAAPARRVLIM